jgi:RNA polymerase sigma-70 factor (ECF subfamily)
MALADFSIQRKIQDGNIKEFEQLFKKYYEPLCHYAIKIVKDVDVAEEVVQEFFYGYWKNRATLSIQLSLNAYLYRSVKNNSLAYLRQQTVRQRYAEKAKSEFNEADSTTVEDEIIAEELSKVIDDTLHQLPERCSTVFQMSRFEGKKYQEIADYLAISIKTVEADMGKALHLFRENLKRHNRVAL